MKELVVLSGKGGTGKTSVVGCLAALAEKKVLVDCDVDAANLHLILQPKIQSKHQFVGGKKARIIEDRCLGCGACFESCRFGAVREPQAQDSASAQTYSVNDLKCEGCGVCAFVCPEDAVLFEDNLSGEWYVSQTAHGPLVHGELGIGQGNSGKLVSQLRGRARELCHERNLPLTIIDGPPGIGCPVIASLTGASYALIVTEPSLTALNDMRRLLKLIRGLQIPAGVCINKFDINESITAVIEAEAESSGVDVIGRIRFDPAVTDAQRESNTVVEFTRGPVASEIKSVCEKVLGKVSALKRNPLKMVCKN